MGATQSQAIDGLAYRHIADICSPSCRRRRRLAVILGIAIGCGWCRGAYSCAKSCAKCSWRLGACCIRIKDVLQCNKVTVVGGSAGCAAAASGTAAWSSSASVAAAAGAGAAGGITIDAWTTLRWWQHLILSSCCPAAAAAAAASATASCNGSLGSSRAIAIRTGHIETMAGYGRIDGIALQIEGGRPSNGLGAIMSNDLQIVINIILSLSL